MTNFWDLFKNPPIWILAILLTILVSHLIHTALKLPRDKLIAVLEFFVVVTIGFITAHSFLAPSVTGKNEGLANPLFLVIALLVFTIVSIVLYLIGEKLSSS